MVRPIDPRQIVLAGAAVYVVRLRLLIEYQPQVGLSPSHRAPLPRCVSITHPTPRLAAFLRSCSQPVHFNGRIRSTPQQVPTGPHTLRTSVSTYSGYLEAGCMRILKSVFVPARAGYSPGDLALKMPGRLVARCLQPASAEVIFRPACWRAACGCVRRKPEIGCTTSRFRPVGAPPKSPGDSYRCSDSLGSRAMPTSPDRFSFVAAWPKAPADCRVGSCYSRHRGGGP